jgi:hypothetical protein
MWRNEPRRKVFDRQRGQRHIAACKRKRRMALRTQLKSMINNPHSHLRITPFRIAPIPEAPTA